MDAIFKENLQKLNDELLNDRGKIKILSFIFEPYIGQPHIDKPLDLFDALERKEVLKPRQMDILYEALHIINRSYLDKYVAPYSLPQGFSRKNLTKICPFRASLAEISENLDKKDLNRLRYVNILSIDIMNLFFLLLFSL